MLRKALGVSFFLYLASLLTSMAGMEIFGWLTFVLAFAVCFQERSRTSEKPAFFRLGSDWALLALLIVVLIGLVINAGPGADYVFILGQLRWGILMFGIAYAARWTKMTEKAFVPLMVVASVVAVHGIMMYFTGWDFVRNKAAFSYVNLEGQARAGGFFGSPMTYAHAAAMTVCFPIAALVMKWGDSKRARGIVMTAGALLFISLIMTFTRGAWISVLCAIAIMTLLVNRKVFVMFLLTVAVAGGSLAAFNPVFRTRILTITDLQNNSNNERLQLWRANWWMFKDYPVFGIGLNDNERRIEEYNIKHGYPDAPVGHAHNNFLQFLSSTGVMGLLAYLAFIGYYLWLTVKLWRVIPRENRWHRSFVLAALGAQVALHVGGLTECNFKDAEVQHQFITILALLSYLRFQYLKQGEQAQVMDAANRSTSVSGIRVADQGA